jgi:hypothetical protein
LSVDTVVGFLAVLVALWESQAHAAVGSGPSCGGVAGDNHWDSPLSGDGRHHQNVRCWCHRVPWPVFLRGGPGIEVLVGGRLWVLRLLLGLPAGVDVGLQGLVETVANGLELELDDWLPRALAAALLDPLVALGVADIRPPPPHPGASLRLGPRASTVIGSALVAAGEEVSLTSTPAN